MAVELGALPLPLKLAALTHTVLGKGDGHGLDSIRSCRCSQRLIACGTQVEPGEVRAVCPRNICLAIGGGSIHRSPLLYAECRQERHRGGFPAIGFTGATGGSKSDEFSIGGIHHPQQIGVDRLVLGFHGARPAVLVDDEARQVARSALVAYKLIASWKANNADTATTQRKAKRQQAAEAGWRVARALRNRKRTSRMARLLGRSGRGQLGPDALPVVRAQVAPRHNPTRDQLNRGAMLDRDRSAASSPLVYERWGDAHMAGKRCRAARIIPIEIGVQVHGKNYSVATVKTQAMLQIYLNSIAT